MNVILQHVELHLNHANGSIDLKIDPLLSNISDDITYILKDISHYYIGDYMNDVTCTSMLHHLNAEYNRVMLELDDFDYQSYKV